MSSEYKNMTTQVIVQNFESPVTSMKLGTSTESLSEPENNTRNTNEPSNKNQNQNNSTDQKSNDTVTIITNINNNSNQTNTTTITGTNSDNDGDQDTQENGLRLSVAVEPEQKADEADRARDDVDDQSQWEQDENDSASGIDGNTNRTSNLELDRRLFLDSSLRGSLIGNKFKELSRAPNLIAAAGSKHLKRLKQRQRDRLASVIGSTRVAGAIGGISKQTRLGFQTTTSSYGPDDLKPLSSTDDNNNDVNNDAFMSSGEQVTSSSNPFALSSLVNGGHSAFHHSSLASSIKQHLPASLIVAGSQQATGQPLASMIHKLLSNKWSGGAGGLKSEQQTGDAGLKQQALLLASYRKRQQAALRMQQQQELMLRQQQAASMMDSPLGSWATAASTNHQQHYASRPYIKQTGEGLASSLSLESMNKAEFPLFHQWNEESPGLAAIGQLAGLGAESSGSYISAKLNNNYHQSNRPSINATRNGSSSYHHTNNKMIPVEIIGLDPEITNSILESDSSLINDNQQKTTKSPERPLGQDSTSSQLHVSSNGHPYPGGSQDHHHHYHHDQQHQQEAAATGDQQQATLNNNKKNAQQQKVVHIHYFHNHNPASPANMTTTGTLRTIQELAQLPMDPIQQQQYQQAESLDQYQQQQMVAPTSNVSSAPPGGDQQAQFDPQTGINQQTSIQLVASDPASESGGIQNPQSNTDSQPQQEQPQVTTESDEQVLLNNLELRDPNQNVGKNRGHANLSALRQTSNGTWYIHVPPKHQQVESINSIPLSPAPGGPTGQNQVQVIYSESNAGTGNTGVQQPPVLANEGAQLMVAYRPQLMAQQSSYDQNQQTDLIIEQHDPRNPHPKDYVSSGRPATGSISSSSYQPKQQHKPSNLSGVARPGSQAGSSYYSGSARRPGPAFANEAASSELIQSKQNNKSTHQQTIIQSVPSQQTSTPSQPPSTTHHSVGAQVERPQSPQSTITSLFQQYLGGGGSSQSSIKSPLAHSSSYSSLVPQTVNNSSDYSTFVQSLINRANAERGPAPLANVLGYKTNSNHQHQKLSANQMASLMQERPGINQATIRMQQQQKLSDRGQNNNNNNNNYQRDNNPYQNGGGAHSNENQNHQWNLYKSFKPSTNLTNNKQHQWIIATNGSTLRNLHNQQQQPVLDLEEQTNGLSNIAVAFIFVLSFVTVTIIAGE